MIAISKWRIQIDFSDLGIGGFPKERHVGYVVLNRTSEGRDFYLITAAGFLASLVLLIIPVVLQSGSIFLFLVISIPGMAFNDTRSTLKTLRQNRKKRKILEERKKK